MNKQTSKTITGNEEIQDLSYSIDALCEFYKAFNSANLQLMQSNWLQSRESSMSNPLAR